MTDKEANAYRIAQLRDDCLALEAQLWGKRMELCLARGERQEAQQHMQAMYVAIQQRYAARHPKQEGGQP